MHAPNGYIDLQVNGYADIDFNADRLVAEDVVRVCGRLRDDGVAGILATVITADVDASYAQMKAKGAEFTMEPNNIRPGTRIFGSVDCGISKRQSSIFLNCDENTPTSPLPTSEWD